MPVRATIVFLPIEEKSQAITGGGPARREVLAEIMNVLEWLMDKAGDCNSKRPPSLDVCKGFALGMISARHDPMRDVFFLR